ncbi:MAG: hypothetical protein IKP10_01750 [Clostridia bacterium]|nr:hypothetical protein [Clostridia bacterium]
MRRTERGAQDTAPAVDWAALEAPAEAERTGVPAPAADDLAGRAVRLAEESARRTRLGYGWRR